MKERQERRRYPRYEPQDGAMVFTFMTRNFGLLEDICMDGLSFRYIAAANKSTPSYNLMEKADRLDIVLGEVDFVLKGVPVKNVADIEAGPFSYDDAVFMRRRRCVQFGELTDDQVFNLKRFILMYTKTGRQRSSKGRGFMQEMPAA